MARLYHANLPVHCKVSVVDAVDIHGRFASSEPTAAPGAILNIGAVAEATGLPSKTIRYYESIGLVKARRSSGNYRLYGERDVMTLRFIERARRLGFSLKEVAELLALWHDRRRASADVRKLAERQIQRVDARLAELREMRRTLQHLARQCHGDRRPDCPILEGLAGVELD